MSQAPKLRGSIRKKSGAAPLSWRATKGATPQPRWGGRGYRTSFRQLARHTCSKPVAPVAYQVILEPGIGQAGRPGGVTGYPRAWYRSSRSPRWRIRSSSSLVYVKLVAPVAYQVIVEPGIGQAGRPGGISGYPRAWYMSSWSPRWRIRLFSSLV